ncbi:hypothetical protein [Nocardia mikamii]|uniref:hypothetical protein n=1 Tax=Nocardia mikamii TaxID=508464 RepID=UPI0007C74C7E|nr:hypothetical protein [Nocardia mikamii]
MLQAQSDPGLRTEIAQRREGFRAAGRPDMVAVGWSDPDAASMSKVADPGGYGVMPSNCITQYGLFVVVFHWET